MKWLLSSKRIIQYFYALMAVSTVMMFDFYIFAVLLRYYDIKLLLILMGIICGTGALLILNSITARTRTIKHHLYTARSLHALFAEILILFVAGTLLISPGPISSLLGVVLYFKPVRLGAAHLLRKYCPALVSKLYAVFIAGHA